MLNTVLKGKNCFQHLICGNFAFLCFQKKNQQVSDSYLQVHFCKKHIVSGDSLNSPKAKKKKKANWK